MVVFPIPESFFSCIVAALASERSTLFLWALAHGLPSCLCLSVAARPVLRRNSLLGRGVCDRGCFPLAQKQPLLKLGC